MFPIGKSRHWTCTRRPDPVIVRRDLEVSVEDGCSGAVLVVALAEAGTEIIRKPFPGVFICDKEPAPSRAASQALPSLSAPCGLLTSASPSPGPTSRRRGQGRARTPTPSEPPSASAQSCSRSPSLSRRPLLSEERDPPLRTPSSPLPSLALPPPP